MTAPNCGSRRMRYRRACSYWAGDSEAAADVITLDGEKLELVSAAIDGEVVAADRLSVSAEALTIRGVPQRQIGRAHG